MTTRSAARWRRRRIASSGSATISIDPAAPLFASVPPDTARLGQPWRFRRRRPRRASPSPRPAPTRRSRRWRPRIAVSTRLLFHPEVAHTDHGVDILRHFAYDVCGCTGDWTMASFVEEATARIREQVGDGRVVCGLSGGVDSTVAAVLDPSRDRRSADVHLRRQRRDAPGRSGADSAAASSGSSLPLVFADASRLFLDRLAGVTDPETKRKIIGARVHRRVRGRKRRSSARSTSWRRARSIPT